MRILAGLITSALVAPMAGCDGKSGGAGRTENVETSSGEIAVWRLSENQQLRPSSTSFTALVTRLECASGVTGEVLPPKLNLSATEIIVTFSVAENRQGMADCQGNNEVPWVVELDEPLGERRVVDGQCLSSTRARSTSFCSPDATRYGP